MKIILASCPLSYELVLAPLMRSDAFFYQKLHVSLWFPNENACVMSLLVDTLSILKSVFPS